MKKLISDYVKSLGGSTCYSGNTKTMYILDKEGVQFIEECVLNKFGFDLPFKLA